MVTKKTFRLQGFDYKQLRPRKHSDDKTDGGGVRSSDSSGKDDVVGCRGGPVAAPSAVQPVWVRVRRAARTAERQSKRKMQRKMLTCVKLHRRLRLRPGGHAAVRAARRTCAGRLCSGAGIRPPRTPRRGARGSGRRRRSPTSSSVLR